MSLNVLKVKESLKIPFINGNKLSIGGNVVDWTGKCIDVFSPVINEATGEKILIGKVPHMDETTTLQVCSYAKKAWDYGRGEWPQMSYKQRMILICELMNRLQEKREEFINLLMWEICKSYQDASSEFDRTMEFVKATIMEYENMMQHGTTVVQQSKDYLAKIIRAPIGIMLALGPSNYPLNETYTSIIPALLAGNVIILKIPTIGGLVHIATQEIVQEVLPKGVMNFLSGPGKEVASAVMKQGVDIFSFVGSSKASDALIREHPLPHRLIVNLSLEGKNIAIVTESANVPLTCQEVITGSTTFNGQRCTALKLTFVHKSIVNGFLDCLVRDVQQLKFGLPWEENVKITPVDYQHVDYLKGLVQDAVSKGASNLNVVHKEEDFVLAGSLMKPVILFPVDKSMKIWKEEQFGPIIAVATYDNIEEVYSYLSESSSGLQCSVFSESDQKLTSMMKILMNFVGRININVQSGRSPDNFPFTGRKSSANGILSSIEALHSFTLPIVISSKEKTFSEDNLNFITSETKKSEKMSMK